MSDEAPSKTQRKKQMHDLQDLGAELVSLGAADLDALGLPERLHDAVIEARGITKHEARRRQMQFIGKLMRDVDPEPIRQRIDALNATSHAEVARLHLIEDWRKRLLAGPAAVEDFLTQHPAANGARLRALIGATGEERAAGRPPRAYRELFKLVRDEIAKAQETQGERRQA